MARVSLPPGYALLPGPPSVADYLDLRVRAGLSLKTEAQPRAALAGGWAACRVEAGGGSVAMGRVIGDGGWYFHVLDMAVLPAHQRRGLGAAVLEFLLDEIRDRAPAEPWVTLLADEPGRPLYERFGFVETAPGSVGMVLRR
jgi:GNAT superfamily N-acetyltransferase